MVTTSFLLVVLFFGGWDFPGVGPLTGFGGAVLKLVIFLLKMSSFIVFYMLIRWTLPRFRFDQLMALAWKVMIPLALVNVLCVMVVKQLDPLHPLWLLHLSLILLMGSAALAGSWPRRAPRVLVVSRGHEQTDAGCCVPQDTDGKPW